MKIEINAKKRDVQGSSASRRLRRASQVPGIVYGGETAPVSIVFDHNELYQGMRKEAFHSSVLTLVIDGAKELVLLRDYQMHAYKQQILHVDFQRVDAKQKLHTKVPLHFVNADVAPGVKLSGGIVSHVLNEVEVACLPADLPEFIEVDLKDLNAGHSLHAADLKLPKGVKLAHADTNPVVATILAVRGAAADEAEAPAA